MTEAHSSEPVRVLVVDDQELFRRGLIMLLGGDTDIEVVGEAADGVTATDLAVKTAPDVILLDVRMPRRTGVEACRAIKEAVPAAKIIMLTVSDEEADLYESVKNGAVGLPAQGLLDRGGRPGDPRRQRGPVADQPVDGGQADRRVQADVQARARAGPRRSG